MPAFLKSGLLSHGQLTGWDPGWYDGFPLYTYYFVLPDLLAALASYVIPYALAFKWVTVLGSVLLPVAAWAMGRLFGMRRAFPGALAAVTLCYLFDYTYTIYGGNLFSTLAGEYAYSLSIALALLFLGLMARGLRTGQHRGWAAVVLAACILAHIVPALFALVGAVILVLMEMLPAPDAAEGRLASPSDGRGRPAGADPAAGSVVGRLDHGASAACWSPSGGCRSAPSRPIPRPWATSTCTPSSPSCCPRRTGGSSSSAGSAPLAAFALRSRFGILMALLAGRVRPRRDLRSPGQPLQRPVPPAVVPPRLPLAGWGVATAVTGAVDLWPWWRSASSGW